MVNKKDKSEGSTYKPEFVSEKPTCGEIIIDKGSVQFGTDIAEGSGRVVSKHGYKGISQIKATLELSNLSSDFVINAFHMVNNPNNPELQPFGANYCDAGGNNPDWNCQEVDLFEANKNVVFQHTMHIGDGSQAAAQNYQYSYSSDQKRCYPNLAPANGIKSWGDIKVEKPVNMVADFDSNGMTITLSQDGVDDVVVYTMGPGYQGSTTFDTDALERWEKGRQQGYWLILSQWQDLKASWAPGSDHQWYDWSCKFGDLCTTSDWFKVYDIEVVADGVLEAPVIEEVEEVIEEVEEVIEEVIEETIEQVEDHPVTNQLLVINNTGQDMKANATYCMQAEDCDYVIKDQDSLLMKTNIIGGTSIFTLYPLGPKGSDPVNGNASQTYGYWSGAGHITSDWQNNYSNPTPWHPAPPANWQFEFAFKNKGDPLKEEVTISIVKSSETDK